MDGNYASLSSSIRLPGSPASPWSGRSTPFATPYSRSLRQVGAPLEEVQAQLDHSNLATTSTYLRMLEGQEDP